MSFQISPQMAFACWFIQTGQAKRGLIATFHSNLNQIEFDGCLIAPVWNLRLLKLTLFIWGTKLLGALKCETIPKNLISRPSLSQETHKGRRRWLQGWAWHQNGWWWGWWRLRRQHQKGWGFRGGSGEGCPVPAGDPCYNEFSLPMFLPQKLKNFFSCCFAKKMVSLRRSHPKDWAGSERKESPGQGHDVGFWSSVLATNNLETAC